MDIIKKSSFQKNNVIVCLMILLFFAGTASASNRKNQIVACGQDTVRIIDMATSSGKDVNVLWTWTIDEAMSQLPIQYKQWLDPFDECKFIDNNDKLLITSSSGGVVLLDIATKKCLFHAYAPMAHSIELLPGNKVAIALSTHPDGNSLEIFDLDTPEKCIFRDSIYSGHGVVWNQADESLYVLNYDELRRYILKDWKTDHPSLTLRDSWKLPIESGHDLSFVDKNRLLVTGHEGVYWFDMKNKKFAPFIPLANVPDVKSVNYNPKTKKLIYTKAEESWWTPNIYQQNPNKQITFPGWRIYKVRVAE